MYNDDTFLVLQDERSMYLQLNPSKSHLADVLVGVLEANTWHHVCLVTETSHSDDGFVSSFLRLTSDHRKWHIEANIRLSTRRDDLIDRKLRDFVVLQSRVIVLHCGAALARRVFQIAREHGLLQRGYAWFVTDDAIATAQRSLRDYPVGVVGLTFDHRRNYHDLIASSVSLMSKAADSLAGSVQNAGISASGTHDCWAEQSKHTHSEGRTLFR